MLSDHEQERLRALERQFLADDLGFTRSFDTRAGHLRRQHRNNALFKIAIMAAVLLGAIMLLAGSPAGAVAFAAAAGLIWLAWRHPNDPSRRST